MTAYVFAVRFEEMTNRAPPDVPATRVRGPRGALTTGGESRGMNTIARTITAALVGAAAAGAAQAQEQEVEVLHWWTSGGEAAAVQVLKEDLESQGVGWQDMAVAGGAGDAARTALKARVASGDAPAAAQMLGMAVREWSEEGGLGDLSAVAEEQNWDGVLPTAIKDFAKSGDAWVAAPVNIHRPHWVWANPEVLARVGLEEAPSTWEEFDAAAEKLMAEGIVPLAHGGQPWQDATIWDAVVLGVGGPEFYRQAVIEADEEALTSDTMKAVFDRMRTLRGYVDPNFSGRDWNLATAMVMNGEAAMQIMGDWAKGEIVAAEMTPGEDILCTMAPGTEGAFLFNTDFFAMFEVGEDKREAQDKLASSIVAPEFQETFNLTKGSIPANTEVSDENFDLCGQKSMADLKAAEEAGTLMGSLAHGHGQPAAVQAAYIDVITEHFNSDMSSDEAVEKLATSVADATF